MEVAAELNRGHPVRGFSHMIPFKLSILANHQAYFLFVIDNQEPAHQ
jgi:hypothetical protein